MRTHTHTRKSSGGLFVPLVSICGLIGLVLVLVPVLTAQFDPIEQQRRALELEQHRISLARSQHLAQQLTPVDLVMGAFWRVLPALVVLVVLVVLLDAYRQRRRPLVRADAAGRLPVGRTYLLERPDDALATIGRSQQVQLVAAQTPALPHTLNYSPRMAAERATLPAAVELPMLTSESTPADAPSLLELLARGDIVRGGPLVLGYDIHAGSLLRGVWTDLLAAAVAGGQHSGKSSTMRFFIVQAALHGARLLIIDPHMHASPEDSLALTLAPLAPSMMCEPAAEPEQIARVIALFNRRLDDRIMGRDSDRTPVLLVIDEYTALMRRGDDLAAELARTVERGGTEARKVKMFVMLGGQTWSVKRTGGSQTRNALQTAYVHRIKRDEARYLLGSDTPSDTTHLPTGAAWLQRASGAELVLVQMPYCPADAVAHVAALLGYHTTAEATAQPLPYHTGGAVIDLPAEAGAVVSDAAQLPAHQDAAQPLRPELVELADLMRHKANQKEKLAQLFGCTATSGREYSTAVERLRTLEQELVERIL